MSPLIFALAAVAGGLGAGLRYLVDTGITRLLGRRFPWGIVAVNVSGSFALGLVAAALPEQLFVVGAGLLGGYTTFSTAMLDSILLWRAGERRTSVLHSLGMLVLGLLAAGAGLALGTAF